MLLQRRQNRRVREAASERRGDERGQSPSSQPSAVALKPTPSAKDRRARSARTHARRIAHTAARARLRGAKRGGGGQWTEALRWAKEKRRTGEWGPRRLKARSAERSSSSDWQFWERYCVVKKEFLCCSKSPAIAGKHFLHR